MGKLLVMLSKIIGLFCLHRWVYTERVNLGVGVFAKYTCQKCRKNAFVPYSGGDRYSGEGIS